VKATLYWPNVGKLGMAPGWRTVLGGARITVRNATEISFFQQKT